MKIEIDNITLECIINRKKIKNIYFRVKEDLTIYDNNRKYLYKELTFKK